MKLLFTAALSIVVVFTSVTLVSANPTNVNKGENNPQVVAFYTDGRHEIPGEEGQDHFGTDLVMQAGKSGNFQQWFWGWSEREGYHGEHSLWLVKKGDSCPDDFLLYTKPNPKWGWYLLAGEDYCVKTNDYRSGN